MKYIFFLIVPFILVGCPVTLYSHLHNQSDVNVGYVYGTGYVDHIDAGETYKVVWKQDCIKLDIDGNIMQYQSAWPNSSVVNTHLFSSSFDAKIDSEMNIAIPDGQVLHSGDCE